MFPTTELKYRFAAGPNINNRFWSWLLFKRYSSPSLGNYSHQVRTLYYLGVQVVTTRRIIPLLSRRQRKKVTTRRILFAACPCWRNLPVGDVRATHSQAWMWVQRYGAVLRPPREPDELGSLFPDGCAQPILRSAVCRNMRSGATPRSGGSP